MRCVRLWKAHCLERWPAAKAFPFSSPEAYRCHFLRRDAEVARSLC
jgi:hypothetical protein